jgi:hypothetical protein
MRCEVLSGAAEDSGLGCDAMLMGDCLQNVGNYSPSDIISNPRGYEFSIFVILTVQCEFYNQSLNQYDKR